MAWDVDRWVQLAEGLGLGSLITATTQYLRARARRARRIRSPETKRESVEPPKREEKREVGGLSWFWKELTREKGAWRAVEDDVQRLSERVAKLEGKGEAKDEAPVSRRRGA